ncbi:MAG: hypothetical protein R2939_14925 [Kofleriaceae bacterium]
MPRVQRLDQRAGALTADLALAAHPRRPAELRPAQVPDRRRPAPGGVARRRRRRPGDQRGRARHAGRLRAGEAAEGRWRRSHAAWVQVARGRVQLGDVTLRTRRQQLTDEPHVRVRASDDAELLVFDLD